jgi:hypothetical protein
MLRLYLLWVSSLFTTSPNGVPCSRKLSPPCRRLSPTCKNQSPCIMRELPFSRLRPQAFSTSRRFSPPPGSRAYFIPKPCTGFVLFRGFSPRAGVLPHRENVAPLPLPERRLAGRNRLPPSLRLDFEALIHTKQRCCSLRLTAPQLAPLVRFASPPGALPAHPVLWFPSAIRS